MSKEREFHELIEQQNREEKDAVWAKLQQKEVERGQEKPIPALPKARSFSWRKWTPILASSLTAVVVGGFATWGFLSLNDGKNNDNKGRYFNSQSYEIVDTQRTIKDYAMETGENLLYFDWYAETDHLQDQVWQLKDTQEIICYNEEIIDVNTGCLVYLFVIQADITIENFSFAEETDRKSEIQSVKIDWRYTRYRAYANFVYEDYSYYLRLEEPIDENRRYLKVRDGRLKIISTFGITLLQERGRIRGIWIRFGEVCHWFRLHFYLRCPLRSFWHTTFTKSTLCIEVSVLYLCFAALLGQLFGAWFGS